MKHITLSTGTETAYINTPEGSFAIHGFGQQISSFLRKWERYFGILVNGKSHIPISCKDIRINHRRKGRYYFISIRLFDRWQIVKVVRRLPKCWIPELDITEDILLIMKEALKDKGLDHTVALLPINFNKDRRKKYFKPSKRLRGVY